MKSYTILFFLCISLYGFSQTEIKKTSISSGGEIATVNNTSLIYSIGETFTQENTQSAVHLSEGFISQKILKTLGVKNYKLFNEFKLYPNPVVSFVNINFTKPSKYVIQISDLNGKIILTKNTINLSNSIDISNLSAGVYLILLKDKISNNYNSVKLLKINK